MKELLHEEYDDYLASLQQPPFRAVRINSLRMPPRPIEGLCGSASKFASNSWYIDPDAPVGARWEYAAGCIYAQEPSASFPVSAMGIRPGMKVFDLCAAPGSKSTQIAEALGNTGLLVANEFVSSRARILRENLERHGASNAIVINCDTRDAAQVFEGYFDAVLCDAPCSGEGMFRKNPEAVSEWSEEAVRACARRQAGILENAVRCLKPGGILVYSTCTFSKEENEDNIIALLSAHPELSLTEIEVSGGREGIASEYHTELCRRIYPMDGGEGHFAAKLRKCGEPQEEVRLPLLKSDPMPAEAESFLREHLARPYPYYYVNKGCVYGGVHPFIDTGRLHLLRHQVLLGACIRGRFEPDHAMAMSSYADFLPRIEINEQELADYMHGSVLKHPGEKGWAAVTVHGQPAGLVKSDGTYLKNHYPKYLRIR